MAERGDIRLVSEGPLRVSVSDASKVDVWSVLARSQLDARLLLAARQNILENAVYQSPLGEVADSFLVVRELEVVPHVRSAAVGGIADYRVTVSYGKLTGGREDAAIGGPPEYWVEDSLVSEPVDVDASGDPIVYTNGEPVDPPLTAEKVTEVFGVTWWVETTDVLTLLGSLRPCKGALNLKTWHGASKGCMLCAGIRKQEQVEVDSGRWAVKLMGRWKYRPPVSASDLDATVLMPAAGATLKSGKFSVFSGTMEGFWRVHANHGFRELDGFDGDGNPKWLPIEDESGRVVSEPVSLDKDGKRLTQNSKQFVVVRKLNARYVDFNGLGV